MTTEQSENTSTKPPDCDSYLQTLVSLVNTSDTGLSFGITVMFGGTVISGDLISYKTYFAKFGDTFASAIKGLGDEGRKSLAEAFVPKELLEADRPKESLEAARPRYIHIDHAVIVVPGGTMPDEASRHKSLWRGRIAAVSGFMLGNFSSLTRG